MEKEQPKNSIKSKAAKSRNAEMSVIVPSANVPVEDIAVLFRCGSCHVAPIKPPVYTCRSGHRTCTGCHRRFGTECFKCKDQLLFRNLVLEEVVRGLPIHTCAALSAHSAPLKESMSEQSLQLALQDPSHLEKLERARMEAERQDQMSDAGDFRTESTTSLASVWEHQSYRPVRCPYPCGRFITCSGLFPHFEFQHPRVMINTINIEMGTHIHIRYDDAVSEERKCIAFLVLRLDDNDTSNPEYCSWSSTDLLRITRSSQEMLRNSCFISILSVGRLANSMESDEDAWFLIVWSTALYEFPPVTYTLTATTDHSMLAVSFTGPLASLQQSQLPADVYERGECLLIPPALQKELRNGKNNKLKITVTYHASLPLPFKLVDCLDLPLVENNLSLL